MAYGVQRGGDAIIANGASVSNAVDLWGLQLVGFEMPASWTAAGLAFQAARSSEESEGYPTGNATYHDLYANGARVFLDVVAGGRYVFDADTIAKFQGVRHIKFVSSADVGATAVNQGAARTIVPLVAQTVNL